MSNVLVNNNYKINDNTADIEESAEFQTAAIESSTLRTQIKVGKDPSSSSFTETNNNNT